MVGEVGHASFVYILASRMNGTLYVGVTANLLSRVTQHRDHAVEGFTKRYDVTRLVYYEVFGDTRLPSSAKSSSRTGVAPGRSS